LLASEYVCVCVYYVCMCVCVCVCVCAYSVTYAFVRKNVLMGLYVCVFVRDARMKQEKIVKISDRWRWLHVFECIFIIVDACMRISVILDACVCGVRSVVVSIPCHVLHTRTQINTAFFLPAICPARESAAPSAQTEALCGRAMRIPRERPHCARAHCICVGEGRRSQTQNACNHHVAFIKEVYSPSNQELDYLKGRTQKEVWRNGVEQCSDRCVQRL
jgi:hypothetical protein